MPGETVTEESLRAACDALDKSLEQIRDSFQAYEEACTDTELKKRFEQDEIYDSFNNAGMALSDYLDCFKRDNMGAPPDLGEDLEKKFKSARVTQLMTKRLFERITKGTKIEFEQIKMLDTSVSQLLSFHEKYKDSPTLVFSAAPRLA